MEIDDDIKQRTRRPFPQRDTLTDLTQEDIDKAVAEGTCVKKED